ncbi:MAG: acyltransferase [Chthoniobacter sp.]|uniref:acyltransferase n=1 Tax=Chthoniobacter sp. TaxID=2510640 RepID=UPI0032A412FC
MNATVPATTSFHEAIPRAAAIPKARRDSSLDFLRFLGVAGIVIAHNSPPAWLFQLRQFDVPLVILISAILIERQYRHRPFTAGEYLRKRAGRILAPTWFFFVLYFLIVALWSRVTGTPFPYAAKAVVGTFLLGSGIGAVWIFRINLAVAVLSPPLLRANAWLGARVWLAIPAIMGLLELINAFMRPTGSSSVDSLIKYLVVEPLPYYAVALIGFNLGRLSTRRILALAAVMLSVFLVELGWLRWAGLPLDTQSYKYPAQIYYLSYALFCSLVLYVGFTRPAVAARLPEWLCNLGAYSMWIYLWHIFWLFVVAQTLQRYPEGAFHSFTIRYVFVLVASIITTLLMRAVASRFVDQRSPESPVAQWTSILFLK